MLGLDSGVSCELIVEGDALNQKAVLIRVPDFIADVWDGQPVGTCIGMLSGDEIRLSKKQGCLVNMLRGKPERSTTGVVLGSSQEVLEDLPDELSISAILESSSTYLPNLLDPAYQCYVASQLGAPEDVQGPKVLSVDDARALEQARVRGGAQDESMFRYFKEEGVKVIQNTGAVSDSQMEAASAALFKLFETSATEDGTLGLRDIQQNIHLPPHHLRKLLEQLTEPQRERLGRRSLFSLKPQFKKH
ncbi:hypothetical protein GNI_056410 [Gregarina niphandrodes]|uniref:Uncharacterized protein n=1 Tax=Gregarina niphandrodes TaxID=110365 RepID=A0A023B8S4_GRENI|nr:hypothetical protein GNI_056410 [Gregarina niphandrodes]EZG70152.1 hypothetical protein GNI_056410 [Gregarina niphandrodes]|eukprot:XP_011129971.1 hypothetical protein GNI_056410 [Gregarina niphandrodes]